MHGSASDARRFLRHAGVLVALVASVGCGDDESSDPSGSGGSSTSSQGPGATSGTGAGDPGGDLQVLQPGGEPLPGQTECRVEIRTDIPIAGNEHLGVCTPIDYASNPPSSGPHWPRWAAFADYTSPVPHEMLVHDLEHGAIVMLHDCETCGTAIIDAFDDAKAAHGIDQKCISTGVTARFIVAPDPDLDFPIAMAAWGATYNATCIDPQSISAFVEAHYAGGPEDVCAAGVAPSSLSCS